MTAIDFIATVICGFILLPPLAYMIGKFATAGYFRARDRYSRTQTNKTKKHGEHE